MQLVKGNAIARELHTLLNRWIKRPSFASLLVLLRTEIDVKMYGERFVTARLNQDPG